MQTTTTSTQFSINWKDFSRGLLMAVLTPVVFIIASSVNAGTLVFDWHQILISALSGGLAYVIKNFFQPSSIVVTNPPSTTVDAVKEGKAEVKVEAIQNK